MIALHGEFDKITGTRIHNRIRHIANKLFDNDKKLPKDDRREFPQCMADALPHHTTGTRSARNAYRRNSSHATGNANSHTSSLRTITGTGNANSRNQNAQNAGSSGSKTRNVQGAATDRDKETGITIQDEHVNRVSNVQDARTGNGQSISADDTTADNNSSKNAGDDEDGVDALSTRAPQTVSEASTADSGKGCGADAVDTADNREACDAGDVEVQGSATGGLGG